MILGVISDTHDNLINLNKIINEMKKYNVDMLIHLGDFVSPFTLKKIGEELNNIKIYAVYGNNDGDKLYLKKIANEYKIVLEEQPLILKIDEHKLFIFHGYNSSEETVEIAKSIAKSKIYSAVFFGHTHKPYLDFINGILILNPGDASGILNRPTFALIKYPSFSPKIIYME
ncbi:metallophosphoesterase [Caldisphaera lagunensis]|nr:metallophosphoesterase [Caldisphaera lagunensis]